MILAWLALLCVGCAIPRDHHLFSVGSSSDQPSTPFLSTDALLSSGLASESLSYGSKGRLFESELRLRKALALDPDNSNIRFNLALVLGQSGVTEEALVLLDGLRAKQGRTPRLLIAEADIRNSLGDLDGARELLKEAFVAFKSVDNLAQAALVARSISNLAFAAGAEQEALCYSYEALMLAPNPQQLGYHGSLLVGMNLFAQANSYLQGEISRQPGMGASVSVHQALALAKFGVGDMHAALKEAEISQDLLAENPELANEVNAIWWLLRKVEPLEEGDDKTAEQLERLQPDVVRLKEKPTYSVLRWPPRMRELLDQVS